MTTEDDEPEAVERRPSPPLADGLDAALWLSTDDATRNLANATVETLRSQETVAALAVRYANVGQAQRAGHLFEVMHALSFNRDAAEHGAALRATPTEWMPGGSQTATADLIVVDGAGRTLDEAQAKLIDRARAAAHDIARPDYAGMHRLLAADRTDHVADLLDKRLSVGPEGLSFTRYADARAYLTDQLSDNGLHSDPVTYAAAQQAAADPTGWAADQVRDAAGHQVVEGFAVGLGAGAVVGAVASAAAVAARVRAGEVPASTAAVTAAGAAVGRMARSGAVSGLGELVEVGGSMGLGPEALADGTLPFAVARTVVAVGEAGLAFARGEITAEQLAGRSAEAAVRSSLVWACGAIGQTVLPIPVIGAAVGGVAGQVAAAVLVRGLQVAVVAARADRAEEARTGRLEDEVRTSVALSAALADATREISRERNLYVAQQVLPLLDAVRVELADAAADRAMHTLAELSRSCGGRPVFTTVDEFDAWMLDPMAGLVLDPNWR